MQYLYRISLGLFTEENGTISAVPDPSIEISKNNCKLIHQCSCIEEIIKIIYEQLEELEEVSKNAGNNLEDLSLLECEQEVRISMSIISLVAIHCHDDNDFLRDLVNSKWGIEELCLKAFKMSLDIPIIPIKKFLFLYCIYLEGLFGGPPKHTVEPVRIITKDVYVNEFRKKQDKAHTSITPVEEFYVT